MTIMWAGLYLCSGAEPGQVAAVLREVITERGYELYDPFGVVPGKAYPEAIRLFVAPPAAGWVRIIGHPQEGMLPELSHRLGPLLYAVLANKNSYLRTYAYGQSVDPQEMLVSFLREERFPDDLASALHGNYIPPALNQAEKHTSGVPLEALPDDIRTMADNLNIAHISRLFNKVMKRMESKVGGGEDEGAARRLLNGNKPEWENEGGQRIRAVMDCLTIPAEYWRTPDFITLRDAYQLHYRRENNPTLRLYPGDAEAMTAVPDALRYIPVYGGKSI